MQGIGNLHPREEADEGVIRVKPIKSLGPEIEESITTDKIWNQTKRYQFHPKYSFLPLKSKPNEPLVFKEKINLLSRKMSQMFPWSHEGYNCELYSWNG